MENPDKREIVYYTEQHTLMTEDVEVFTDEKVCNAMLQEELTDSTKRELFQTYYLHALNDTVKIKGKHNYGDWNASIGNISNTGQYLDSIQEKLAGNITLEDIEKNIKIIHNITGLSDEEKSKAEPLKEIMQNHFLNNAKKLKM